MLHKKLQHHLITDSGEEAAAIILCSRIIGKRTKLVAKQVLLVPHDQCSRGEAHLTWDGAFVEEALDMAEEDDLSLLLIHSHPGGYYQFSDVDDDSDKETIPSIFMGRSFSNPGDTVHGSVIMIPGGKMRGRIYNKDMAKTDLELITVVGDELDFQWLSDGSRNKKPMAFTQGMRDELSKLSVCFIGVSGTGSISSEQAGRLGFGEISLIDFDTIEKKNLNRILYSTLAHANSNSLKVDVMAAAIKSYRDNLQINAIPTTITGKEAIYIAAEADVLVCCVDSEEGRQIADHLASCCVIPLFDVGVTIPVREGANGDKVIMDILGRIDYIQPGGSMLINRGVYTPASLAAEYMARTNPEEYKKQVQEGYMPGVAEEAPSVISVNMRAASACINEFIARTYPFRLDPNHTKARTIFSLASNEEDYFPESTWPDKSVYMVGTGLKSPLLGIPSLEG
ncbi:MAG: ThiF family adenylyltransferase [Candidatus Methylopumilus sp.]